MTIELSHLDMASRIAGHVTHVTSRLPGRFAREADHLVAWTIQSGISPHLPRLPGRRIVCGSEF